MQKSVKLTSRNQALQCEESRTSSFPPKSPHSKMHPQNSLRSYCSLLIQINVLIHLAGSFNASKPLSQLQNHHGSLLGLTRRFLAFFTMISNFNKMVNCELLIIGFQQLDSIYSIITSYLSTCLNIFGLGAYDVSAEQ